MELAAPAVDGMDVGAIALESDLNISQFPRGHEEGLAAFAEKRKPRFTGRQAQSRSGEMTGRRRDTAAYLSRSITRMMRVSQDDGAET
jgi:hypothetical protein